jgi:putative Mg2+ transporter-C (MgtC) family protein
MMTFAITDIPLTHGEMVLRMATATLLGAAIGYERGRSDHPAGLRTHILVALASSMFMLVSTQFVYFQHYAHNELLHVDPSRIASGVVMGMGFLGAGSILRRGFDVHGLTTAASLWLVSAVGLAAGSGMFLEAIIATGGALFALVGLTVLETRYKQAVRRRLHLVVGGEGPDRNEILALVKSAGAQTLNVNFEQDLEAVTTKLVLEVRFPNAAVAEEALRRLMAIPGLRHVGMVDEKPPVG